MESYGSRYLKDGQLRHGEHTVAIMWAGANEQALQDRCYSGMTLGIYAPRSTVCAMIADAYQACSRLPHSGMTPSMCRRLNSQ